MNKGIHPPLAQKGKTAQDKKITSEAELIAALREQIKWLQAENAWLKERPGLNAENSSIPPSQKPVRQSKLSPPW